MATISLKVVLKWDLKASVTRSEEVIKDPFGFL